MLGAALEGQGSQGADGMMLRAGGQEVDIRRSTFAALQEQPTPAGHDAHRQRHHELGKRHGVRLLLPCDPTEDSARRGDDLLGRPEGGKAFNAGAIASGWTVHSDRKFQTLMRNVLAHFGV
jgi:hypothetical protein